LPEEAFVFCCFNNTHKINAAMFDIWMRLLERLPQAALWLLSTDDAVRAHLQREAVLRGVDAARLVFARRMPYADHLCRLKLADLFLDTLPFNAGTTASDALWAGLPVLTCAGDAFAARMAGSLLRSAGLPELITDRADQYEAKALELAQRPPELDSLRRRLEQNRRSMPLFDTDRSRRHLEAAYEQMWGRYQQSEPPAGFDLQDQGPSEKPVPPATAA
jgi:protein O-GlcNAc transferase